MYYTKLHKIILLSKRKDIFSYHLQHSVCLKRPGVWGVFLHRLWRFYKTSEYFCPERNWGGGWRSTRYLTLTLMSILIKMCLEPESLIVQTIETIVLLFPSLHIRQGGIKILILMSNEVIEFNCRERDKQNAIYRC